MSKTKFVFEKYGYSVDIGSFAQQADGAAWMQQGGTVVLSTVVQEATKEFPGFLPLTVDYREQFSAAGKIPGGYFKREGKWTDKEVLTARLIDRAIRPLFPEQFFNQLQIYNLLLSFDQKHTPTALAILATSIALCVSKIPFMEPIGGVELARIDGKWIANPILEERLKSDVRLTIAGTADGICMVEGVAHQLSESDLIDALFIAHGVIKEQVSWQREIMAAVGVVKDVCRLPFDWNLWMKRADEFLTLERVRSLCKASKSERSEAMQVLRDAFAEPYLEQFQKEPGLESFVEYIFDVALKPKITNIVFADGKRIDGRKFDEVRSVSTSVGLLPNTHGSSLFARGGTQALTTATLGSSQDEPRTETLVDEEPSKAFILHYNFPPFSVGEVRPMRGPSRRDVGHGNLAASALLAVLPDKGEFPYTIRIVTDILASDGSSSMATVCGSVMALMDAGIPIERMVSGVAMGLLQGADGKFQPLTDITGFEDNFGLMDFKVAGSELGITAIQMDIKYKGGLHRSVFERALEQARRGRLHILECMQKVMSEPRPQMSPLVPKVVVFNIDTDKIGAVIGGGGKVIREIIDKTKTTIDIEADGKVNIFGGPDTDIDKAVQWVKVIAGQIKPGDCFRGTVSRVAEFGVFVDLVPGQAGLIHVSAIARDHQRTMMRDFPVGMEIDVKVTDYDPSTGRIRLAIDQPSTSHKK